MPNDPIDDIIRREGAAYTDHAADRGGPTKWGITQATLASYRKIQVTPFDVAALTETDARAIYTELFIRRPHFDQINDERLRALVIDCGVNHGTGTAAKWLQTVTGVHDDGVLGPVTLEAVNALPATVLHRRILGLRIKFYGRIITNDPKQAVFAAGWMARAAEFLEA
jgi:lysozyme family protein